MEGLEKPQIAAALREIAVLLQFRDENQFKIRAFENAARALAGDPRPLDDLVLPGGLEKIKGIGKATADIIRGLALTGQSPMLDELRLGTPTGLASLMRVPALGAKKIGVLYAELGINTLEELEVACREGRIAECRGFTKKSADKILAGIEQARRYSGQLLLAQALVLAEPILEALRSHPAVFRAEIAGSLRRCKEVVGDIDFVASSDNPAEVMAFFSTSAFVQSVVGSGPTKTSVLLLDDVQADLRVVPDAQFATALHHFTGSKEHNTQMRSRALKMGLKVNEYGVFPTDDASAPALPVVTEDDIFAALKLATIPPELREGQGEIEAAAADAIPALVTRADYTGVLHCHTTWSDGKHTIREMAEAARDLHNWQYFAVCDHSEVAAYAGGVKKGEIPEQHAEIDEVNAALASDHFRVFKSCECDILKDGSLDYPDVILATMDLVVASVHSRHNQSAEEMTDRLIRALENPYVTVLGHISGRLLLSRDPYPFDVDEVLKAAARTKTAIEINSDPRRLDIDWRYCRRAKELGVIFSVNPDAHAISALKYVDYGISMARKGWLTAADIVNCLPLKEFMVWATELRAWKLNQAVNNWAED